MAMMINRYPFYFSQHLGVLLPPTGDSALQSRSIFQVAEPSVFVPACEKEKAAVEGRSLAYNVSLPSESPAPFEMREEGKKDPAHKSTTSLVTTSGDHPSTAVSLSTSFESKLPGNMDRRRQEEQRSLDYRQNHLLQQQYEQQQCIPQDDEQYSIRQCESSNTKLCERTSSLTTSHQQPIAAGESAAVEGHAAATRPSSPPNLQQTIERGQTAHPSKHHHPVVASSINISSLATNEPSAALNEEYLRAQLVQRDQEIADIIDRCVMGN